MSVYRFTLLLVPVLACLAWASLSEHPSGLFGVALAQTARRTPDHSTYGRPAPSLNGAIEWVNSPPLTTRDLRGKVVLIDFWTYSCINWRREFPYVRAWHRKYRGQGLVVVGVHSPEFAFEKQALNVRRAISELGVDYPVAIDSDHAIWRAFSNAYWPALYFVDAGGNVRHQHFGEGDFAQSERVIQQLLEEAGAVGIDHSLVEPIATGAELAADWEALRSPESYLGYARAGAHATDGMQPNKPGKHTAPTRLGLNEWALAGDWTWRAEAVVANAANARVIHRFQARDLHLVMGPAKSGRPIRFRLTIDGKAPGSAHGVDTDNAGHGLVTRHRMYQLIRQPRPIGERRFEIEFLDPGVEAFSFTFG